MRGRVSAATVTNAGRSGKPVAAGCRMPLSLGIVLSIRADLAFGFRRACAARCRGESMRQGRVPHRDAKRASPRFNGNRGRLHDGRCGTPRAPAFQKTHVAQRYRRGPRSQCVELEDDNGPCRGDYALVLISMFTSTLPVLGSSALNVAGALACCTKEPGDDDTSSSIHHRRSRQMRDSGFRRMLRRRS